MLTRLHVRNFAIIDEVEIELEPGMTVLTGETGAGKSILVDALGLVLGERGGTGLVRTASRRAEFNAEFDLADAEDARAWLAAQSLDADDECLLRRVVTGDGRSRAFINGNAVPLQSLKTLGEKLLDIHGQHFHQSLARRDVQRDALDHYGGHRALRAATAEAYANWRSLAEQLQALEDADADRASRLDLLRFQTQELQALALKPGEYDALLAERERCKHQGELAASVSNALQALYDDESANAHGLLAAADQSLAGGAEIDPALHAIRRLLDDAAIQVSEAADALNRYRETTEIDPERQEQVEERVDAVRSIARKHRVEADRLGDIEERLSKQLDDLTHAEETGARLVKAARDAEQDYREAAESLSAARKGAASRFGAEVTDAMHGLGMPEGRFEIGIHPRATAAAFGMDDINYLIGANAGQPPMPLAKIASGGELSRMSLAIQLIASDGSAIPTMIFDEVDAGVGGSVAEMVGRSLRDLGTSRQVLCVTHLPQVASLADSHFRVIKMSDGKTTRTAVTRLNEDERVEELARMLGGVKITRRTRDHAAEMLAAGRRTNRRRTLRS